MKNIHYRNVKLIDNRQQREREQLCDKNVIDMIKGKLKHVFLH